MSHVEREGKDGCTYRLCQRCGYYFALGPQLGECPHEVPEWIHPYWRPEFGALWMETPTEPISPTEGLCRCDWNTILMKGCQCGGN